MYLIVKTAFKLVQRFSSYEIPSERELAMDVDNFITEEFCLACLTINPTKHLTTVLSEVYIKLTCVELPEDLPKKICQTCDGTLRAIQDYRSSCIESFDWLMEMREKYLNKNATSSFNEDNKTQEDDNVIDNTDILNDDMTTNCINEAQLNPTEDDMLLMVTRSSYDTLAHKQVKKSLNKSKPKAKKKSKPPKKLKKPKRKKRSTPRIILKITKVESNIDFDNPEKITDSKEENEDTLANLDDIISDKTDMIDNDIDAEYLDAEINDTNELETLADIALSNELKMDNMEIEEQASRLDPDSGDDHNNEIIKEFIQIENDNDFADFDLVDEDVKTNVTAQVNNQIKTTKQIDLTKNDSDSLSPLHKNKENKVPDLISTVNLIDLDKCIKDNFHALVLSENEKIEEFKKRKYSNNYKNGKFKCDKCYRGFSIEDSYNNHMKLHSEKHGNYSCDKCLTHYKSQKCLNVHNHNSHTYLLSCKLCFYTTGNIGRAKLHIAWHNCVQYKCKFCGTSFEHKTTLENHQSQCKPVEEAWCAVCGTTFRGQAELNAHLQLRHNETEKHVDGPKCDLCKISFANYEALSTHKATSELHGGKKNIPTHGIRRLSRRKQNMSIIVDICKKEQTGPKKCALCNLVFPNITEYTGHFKSSHPEESVPESNFVCFICGKSYKDLNAFYTHLDGHDVGETLECDLCGSTFTNRLSLKKHKLEHKYAKKAQDCDLCGKRFQSKFRLKVHKLRKHDERNEKCDFCKRTFKTLHGKKLHMDRVHLNKPEDNANQGPI